MINSVGNADLSCVYKGPIVPLQSLYTIAETIKLMSLFLRTAQASCKRNKARILADDLVPNLLDKLTVDLQQAVLPTYLNL